MTTVAHTIDEALGRFELVSGAGSEQSEQACAMTLLAWIRGREWTDHPECVHSRIAYAVIAANDATSTTSEMRAELVRLGMKGALDTWWVPDKVIAWAMRREKDAECLGAFDRAVLLMKRVAAWKRSKGLPSGANLYKADLRGANLYEADLYKADLRGANLYEADLHEADLRGADLREADLHEADLRGANLYKADLRGAAGTPQSGMPDGWKLDENGLWVKS